MTPREVKYNINQEKYDVFKDRLLDKLGIDFRVIGLSIKEIDKDSCQIVLRPNSEYGLSKYQVSNHLLTELLEDDVIRRKEKL